MLAHQKIFKHLVFSLPTKHVGGYSRCVIEKHEKYEIATWAKIQKNDAKLNHPFNLDDACAHGNVFERFICVFTPFTTEAVVYLIYIYWRYFPLDRVNRACQND